jgi:flagellar biogenesis protein FliO
MENPHGRREETADTASSNMGKFVIIIFIIALVLAALWFFVLTPGTPQ